MVCNLESEATLGFRQLAGAFTSGTSCLVFCGFVINLVVSVWVGFFALSFKYVPYSGQRGPVLGTFHVAHSQAHQV